MTGDPGARPPGVARTPPPITATRVRSKALDVDSYLQRIAQDPVRRPDADALRRLHRAHVTSIPFENVDAVIGREVSLDVDQIADKIVQRHRGGYCYEHNILFCAVLRELGYRVRLLVGRVRPSRSGPRSHMALLVHADGVPWLADVGFGGPAQLLEPLNLWERGHATQDGWRYRLASGSWARSRVLQAADEDGQSGWEDQYEFTLEPHRLTDYRVLNYYMSTNPESPFVRRLVVQSNSGRVRHRLVGDRLVTVHPGSRTGRDVRVPPGQVAEVLADVFGVELDPGDEAAVVAAAERFRDRSGPAA